MNKYFRLTPIRRTGSSQDKAKFALWEFQCDCGKIVEAPISVVKRGRKKSCGCLAIEVTRARSITHGFKGTKVYAIWSGMKNRCNNPNEHSYKNYGARGIKVCKSWERFESFLKDMGEPPKGKYSLDRIDNDKGYSKANCRWATDSEQQRNTRANTKYEYLGESYCLAEWAERTEIPYVRLWSRVKKQGWSLTRAIEEPLHLEKVRY